MLIFALYLNNKEMINTISKELIEKARVKLIEMNEYSPLQFYWDYNGRLSNKQISKIIDGRIDEVEDSIWVFNLDYMWDLEDERLKEVFECVNTDDALNYEDVRDELRDELLDYLGVDINFQDLLDRTGDINVRLEMLSNYDRINSHYFETCRGYKYEKSYFGDMVDVLNLNPKKVKAMLTEKGIKTFGKWRNKAHRDGKEYVSYEDFWQELENSCCGVNLLTFMGTISLTDFLKGRSEATQVTIPKGNYCGLYSSFQGGGSVLEMQLKRDFTAKLEIKNHLGFRIIADDSDSEYSIREVYGLSHEAWGKT